VQLAARKLCLERLINTLLALHAVQAGELGADDQRLEVLAVAVEFELLAGHAGTDKLLNMFRIHFGQALNFQPRFSKLSVSKDTAAKQATTTARLNSGATSETPKKP